MFSFNTVTAVFTSSFGLAIIAGCSFLGRPLPVAMYEPPTNSDSDSDSMLVFFKVCSLDIVSPSTICSPSGLFSRSPSASSAFTFLVFTLVFIGSLTFLVFTLGSITICSSTTGFSNSIFGSSTTGSSTTGSSLSTDASGPFNNTSSISSITSPVSVFNGDISSISSSSSANRFSYTIGSISAANSSKFSCG